MKTTHERARTVCESLNLPANGVAYLKIKRALQEQDRDTRHACAEAVLGCESPAEAHNACINVKAV